MTSPSPVALMFAVNEHWAIPLAVAIRSLIAHSSPNRQYRLHVVHNGLSDYTRSQLQQLIQEHTHIGLSFHSLPPDLVDLFNRQNYRQFSALSFARLFAPQLFPEYNKMLYLDADIVLKADVAELFDRSLGAYLIGLAHDHGTIINLATTGKGFADQEPILPYIDRDLSNYCNSGVLLMDLAMLRAQNTQADLLPWLEQPHGIPFSWPDQDLLNIVFHRRIAVLPDMWNFSFASLVSSAVLAKFGGGGAKTLIFQGLLRFSKLVLGAFCTAYQPPNRGR